ncbi:ATP-binding protein [Myxococcus sp. K38C18041901]|uniref:ATP-binding protein n=1 Tax=Myxococcus guangdongensis TaxID=2906760 RepID=UPI0020A712CC|nr:ATP-binding protein [Myxococcus guangdongensis]MCP3064194.1 ATP-binding protein [Myxococcus guangdongensis]
MSRVPSLRRRLAVTNAVVLGAALFGFSLLLHAVFTRALTHQFDNTLAAEARAIASLIERKDDGRWEVESSALLLLTQADAPSFFEVRSPDGQLITRSAGLREGQLPRTPWPAEPVHLALELPQGLHGRMFTARLPAGDEEEGAVHVVVSVARETGTLDTVTSLLTGALVATGATTLVLAILAGVVATRRGLRPLEALASRVEAIDGARLDTRLEEAEVPDELRPVVTRLNGLLARLEVAFERERQFSADVSHELRTPLSGLRTILEVSAMRERSPREHATALAEALGVVGLMQGLVERLLLLARLDARQMPVKQEAIALRQLVDASFTPLAGRARSRGLRFENLVEGSVVLRSDREKLRLILGNLLGNATDYTEAGGIIRVSSDLERGLLVEVEDSGPHIPPPILERIFERFYRADASRTGTEEHSGIGLSLVRSLAGVLGATVSAENRPGGWVAFVVRHDGGAAGPSPHGGDGPG